MYVLARKHEYKPTHVYAQRALITLNLFCYIAPYPNCLLLFFYLQSKRNVAPAFIQAQNIVIGLGCTALFFVFSYHGNVPPLTFFCTVSFLHPFLKKRTYPHFSVYYLLGNYPTPCFVSIYMQLANRTKRAFLPLLSHVIY